MQQITQPLTPVTWYGPTLVLANAPWKNNVAVVRLINAGGTGYSSFDPAQTFNSLTQVVAGQVLITESLAAAYSAGYALDNGTAPTAGAGSPISWPSFSEAGSGPATELDGLVDVSQSYAPTFAFSAGSGTLQMQLNGSGTWVAAGVVTAGTTAQFRILNAAPFAGVLTLTPA